MKIPDFKLSKDEMKYIRNIAILAMILNFIIEVLNIDSLLDTLQTIASKPHIFLYNSLIILTTLSITLLLKRRIVGCTLISTLWLAFGITNNVLLNFRTTPFTAVDFTLISEAIPIMDKYLTGIQIVILGIVAVFVIIGLIFAFVKLPKHKGIMNYISNSCAIAFIVLITFGLTSIGMRTNVLAKNFGNIGDAFKDYGFAYCFANSLINTGIDKPNNYSEETIQNIVETAEDTPTPTQVETVSSDDSTEVVESKTPNIIFLQLESFFDPTHVKDLTFSSDPLPNYHYLMENYTSGYLNVPSVGAGTANTEFEIITGMDLDFFGPGEYPYKTILRESTCESMAYNLKELGYSTHAIHNNTATFYGRNKVFSNLGFDSFTSEEYMENISYNPLGWANDDVLVEEILNVLNSTDATDYIYTISVQGHGKYPSSADSLYDGTTSPGIDGDFAVEDSTSTSSSSDSDLSKDETASSSPTQETVSSDGSITSSSLSDSQSESLQQDSTEHEILIDGIDEDRAYAFEYYVNQIHEMDTFVGNLVAALEEYDEDVILVMYGDHLPSLGIEEDDLDNGNMYQTQYIIWSSNGVIDGQYDRDLEAYQLSAYTLSLINQNPGLLTKLHQQELSAETTESDTEDTIDSSAEATPAVIETSSTDTTTLDDDGNMITYLDELNLLQYDMLYGKQECYVDGNPYEPTLLQMGVLPITIDSVEYIEGCVTITGQHFTKFSKIEVNGELVETTFIDNNTLTYVADDLPVDTNICIVQMNDDDTELSRTDVYITE